MNGIRATGPPRRDATGEARQSDFTALAQTIRERGLLRRRYGYYWTKLIALPLTVAAGVIAFIWVGDTWWQMFTAVGFAILFTQIAFLGHDAAHRQMFISGQWNDWASLILGDLLVGMSYGWWQHKHTRHHANPNRIDVDPDIDLPVIALNADQVSARDGRSTSWLRAHQGVFFFPILLFEGLSLHASGIRRVCTRQHLNRRWVEVSLLLVRLGGFTTMVFLVLSPGVAFAFLGVQLGIFGFYMGVSFAPNHKGMPLVPKDLRIDFLRRQVMMSRNIRGSRLLDAAMGGLNYQIEHHLFPSMPRPHLRKAAPIVAEYCRTHAVPYLQTGLLESYATVIRYINKVGLGERDVFTCPLAQQRQHIMTV